MKEITLYPADIYQVLDKSLLSEYDKQVLNMLYMPIIGNNAISLYLKLQSEAYPSYISNEYTHHHLMTSMSLNLNEIREARLKLEALGLLKCYYLSGELNYYVYELYSPVSSQEFFSHPIFNIVLYNNVGKEEYNRLLDSFKLPKVSLKDYKDISSSIDEVFKISKYTSIELNTENLLMKNKQLINYAFDYDFNLIISSLNGSGFNEKCLNKGNKDLIINLSFLYELDPISMADIIKASLNEKGNIDKELLRKNCKRYYQFNNENRLPGLLFKSQPEYLKSAYGDNTRRGRIIKLFETLSPYEFLKRKYKGAKPTNRDMTILENLLIDLKLNPAVINVLIDYVLKINNNKLTKEFIEAIASQWKLKGIETATEAMEHAEKEHKKRYTKKETKKESKKVPSWFNEKIESNADIKTDEELNNILKEFRK